MLYNPSTVMLNQQSARDIRKVLSGKDGGIFDLQGYQLASVEQFQAQANITNAKYNPLGDAYEHEVFTLAGVTLTFTEVLICDLRFVEQIYLGMQKGDAPFFNFQGYIRGRDGQEQRVIYRQCVPSGNIDLQNLSVGDVIKRQWSWYVNEPPTLQNWLGGDYGGVTSRITMEGDEY